MSTSDRDKAVDYALKLAARETEESTTAELLARGFEDGLKKGRGMGHANAIRKIQGDLGEALREAQEKAWEEGYEAGWEDREDEMLGGPARVTRNPFEKRK